MSGGDRQQVNINETGQGQLPVVDAGQGRVTYATMPYQTHQALGTTLPLSVSQLTNPSQVQLTEQQLSYKHMQQQQLHQLKKTLQMFWSSQYHEIATTSDFKNHSLPLARIKKIMKADEDVRMIAAEAPVLFARACEMFILELTMRSWAHAEENKRRTLQKNDIAGAIMRSEAFDFLVDIVPREEVKEEVAASGSNDDGSSGSLPYYYMQSQVGSLGMIMNKPAPDSSLYYAQQSLPYMPQQIWEQQQQQQQQQQPQQEAFQQQKQQNQQPEEDS